MEVHIKVYMRNERDFNNKLLDSPSPFLTHEQPDLISRDDSAGGDSNYYHNKLSTEILSSKFSPTLVQPSCIISPVMFYQL